jgi:tetraacyldisaccharide 4'-kinase
MTGERAAERLWRSDSPAARSARTALRPLEAAYAAATLVRGALYRFGVLASHELALPAASVGNLSVGGTGKTPVAAWLASALRERGATPAILLRGYGGDEPLVHVALNPGLPVVVDPDRVRGATEAKRRGADVVVLDDAFQHLRARRLVDLVLLSADQWSERRHLLPAGPWREPLRALQRATVVLVTRKAVSLADAERVAGTASEVARSVRTAIAHLAPRELRTVDGEAQRLAQLAGKQVLAIAAIADPASFLRQLRALGADPQFEIFADHHPFGAADAARLAARAEGVGRVVCTLKDAVKLAPHWPRGAPPLWYVSQHVIVERGAEHLEALLATLLQARTSYRRTASERGHTDTANGH